MWCGSRGGQWPHFVGNASFGTGIRSWLRDSTHQLFWVDLRYRISTFGSFCRIVVYGAIDPDVIMTQEALFFNSFQFNLLTRTIFSWEFLTTGHGPLVLQIPQTRRGICVFFCKGKVPKISCCTRSDLTDSHRSMVSERSSVLRWWFVANDSLVKRRQGLCKG